MMACIRPGEKTSSKPMMTLATVAQMYLCLGDVDYIWHAAINETCPLSPWLWSTVYSLLFPKVFISLNKIQDVVCIVHAIADTLV